MAVKRVCCCCFIYISALCFVLFLDTTAVWQFVINEMLYYVTPQITSTQRANAAYVASGLVDLSGCCRGNCPPTAAAASSSCIILAMFGEECDRDRPPLLLAGGVSVLRGALYDSRPLGSMPAYTAASIQRTIIKSHNALPFLRPK